MTSRRRFVRAGVVVWLAACAAMAQDTTDKRIAELERQIHALKTQTDEQIQALTKQLEQARQAQEIDRRIDELTNRMKGLEEQKPDATAGYKKGFYLKSADDLFALQFFGRVQFDWWNYEGGPIEPWGGADFSDTFFLRRIRFGTKGHLWGEPHKFMISAEFAENTGLEVRDGYLELDYVPWLKVRMGQYKVPFSREALQSRKYIQFVERSLAADNLAPGRDMGIMAHGELFDGRFDYATGVFNGTGENNPNDNDDYDWAYRVNFKPFKKSGNPWLEGFELGHNVMIGNQRLHRGIRGRTAADVDFFNPGGVAALTDPTGSTNVLAAGTRNRVGVDGVWYIGPFGLTWEYIHVEEHRHNVDVMSLTPPFPSSYGPIDHNGWQVTTSWLLTGEKKHAGAIKPNHNFDPVGGTGWGAWEVACRISQLEEQSRDNLFNYTYVDPFGNVRVQPFDHQQDTAFTFGVNWYLNPNMIFKAAWTHDMFDERLMSPEHDIDTVQAAFQIFW